MLFIGRCSREDFAKNKRRFYIVGAIMLLLGFVSLTMPLLASLAVETMIGCLLLAVVTALTCILCAWALSRSENADYAPIIGEDPSQN